MELIDDYYVFFNKKERELWPNAKFKYNELIMIDMAIIEKN